jgi:hypothetical protein
MVCFGFAFYTAISEGQVDPDKVLHSWSGLTLVPALVVHLLGNAPWIRRLWRTRRRDREARLAGLNLALAVTMLTCVVSGSTLWFGWSHATLAVDVHEASSFITTGLVVSHLIMNRKRLTFGFCPGTFRVGNRADFPMTNDPWRDPVGPKTTKAQVCDLGFLWWRGQDLNL